MHKLVIPGLARALRTFSTSQNVEQHKRLVEMYSHVRNIGIVAHIDAGKTTTTERMLYYSGATRAMGEVHDGDTVMDYMAQERERGITITIASATILWKQHRIQLIDTPGHVDFTFEVERSLSVLDGAVVVLDASAGVQAQTAKVWRQANRFHLARLVYLNKMDKPNASVTLSLDSMRHRLNIEPLQLQLAVHGEAEDRRSLAGLIDVVTGDILVWPQLGSQDHVDSDQGKRYRRQNLIVPHPQLVPFLDNQQEARERARLMEHREHLIGQLVELDEHFAEYVLHLDHLEDVKPEAMHASIRRLTLRPESSVVGVLLGSSYRNVGVQPLLDAVCHYLPQPLQAERAQHLFTSYNGDVDLEAPLSPPPYVHHSTERLCALAYKIITDPRLGCLTFIRLYSGQLQPGQSVYNVNRDCFERVGKIYRAFANNFVDISKTAMGLEDGKDAQAITGDIVAVSGLVHTITGDTLVLNDDESLKITLAGIEVPEPVFYCSLEAPSMSKMKQLELVLQQLEREDPSLKVSNDKVNDQLVLKGMGELHIEIIKDRIRREHSIEVSTGPLQVAYRETITNSHRSSVQLAKAIGGVNNRCSVTLEIRPEVTQGENNLSEKSVRIKLINTKEKQLTSLLKPWHIRWIEAAVKRALEYGPLHAFPVVGIEVDVHDFHTTNRTSQAFVTSAIERCMLEAMREAGPVLLEPIMRLEIRTPESHLGAILSDLSNRRAEFGGNETTEENETLMVAYVPLSELINYSSSLRQLSSGLASLEMALHSYRAMDAQQTQQVLRHIQGVD